MLEFKCAYGGEMVRINPADVESIKEDEWAARDRNGLSWRKVAIINMRPGKGKQRIVTDPKREVALKVFSGVTV